jgi:hypothetical protein
MQNQPNPPYQSYQPYPPPYHPPYSSYYPPYYPPAYPQHNQHNQSYQPYQHNQHNQHNPLHEPYQLTQNAEPNIEKNNYPIVLYQTPQEITVKKPLETPLETSNSDIHYHIPPSYPIIEYSDNIIILPGNIVTHVSDQIPDGYLLCDGSDASREVDSILFSVIGTFYGDGDGSTTFCLPDIEDENQSHHYMIKR